MNIGKSMLAATVAAMIGVAFADETRTYTDESGTVWHFLAHDGSNAATLCNSGSDPDDIGPMALPLPKSGVLKIPSTVKSGDNTYKVSRIAASAFTGFGAVDGLTVELPDTLVYFDMGNADLGGLDGFTIKNSKRFATEEGALYNNTKTKLLFYPRKRADFKLPGSVREINDYACAYWCGAAGSLEIPEGVALIGKYAFMGIGNDQLASTKKMLPSTLKRINYRAFFGCDGFKTVWIPSSVEKIELSAFGDCRQLKKYVVADANRSYLSENGILYTRSGATLVHCPPQYSGELIVRPGVKKISTKAFFGCGEITSIMLPTGVELIAEDAFQNCGRLTQVYLPASLTDLTGAEFPSLDEMFFTGCSKLKKIYIDTGERTRLNRLLCKGLYSKLFVVRPEHSTTVLAKKVGFTKGGTVTPKEKTGCLAGDVVRLEAKVEKTTSKDTTGVFLGWYADKSYVKRLSKNSIYGYKVPAQMKTEVYARFASAREILDDLRIGIYDFEVIPGVKMSEEVHVVTPISTGLTLSGELPKGLHFKEGVIYGTPAKSSSKDYVVTLVAKCAAGTKKKTVKISVKNPGYSFFLNWSGSGVTSSGKIVKNDTVTMYTGVQQTIEVRAEAKLSSPSAATTISVEGLPPGLEYDSKKGVISGTPTQRGTYAVAITAKNKFGWKSTFKYTIVVKYLPSWAYGDFIGGGELDTSGFFSDGVNCVAMLTLGKTGKLSGKIWLDDDTLIVTGSGLRPYNKGGYRFKATAKLVSSEGKETKKTVYLSRSDDGVTGLTVGDGMAFCYRDEWASNPKWQEIDSLIAGQTLTLDDEYFGQWGSVAVRFSGKGRAQLTDPFGRKATAFLWPNVQTRTLHGCTLFPTGIVQVSPNGKKIKLSSRVVLFTIEDCFE